MTARETIATADFHETPELGAAIRELLDAGRRTGALDQASVAHVLGASGHSLWHARLVREALTGGSAVFNLVLAWRRP